MFEKFSLDSWIKHKNIPAFWNVGGWLETRTGLMDCYEKSKYTQFIFKFYLEQKCQVILLSVSGLHFPGFLFPVLHQSLHLPKEKAQGIICSQFFLGITGNGGRGPNTGLVLYYSNVENKSGLQTENGVQKNRKRKCHFQLNSGHQKIRNLDGSWKKVSFFIPLPSSGDCSPVSWPTTWLLFATPVRGLELSRDIGPIHSDLWDPFATVELHLLSIRCRRLLIFPSYIWTLSIIFNVSKIYRFTLENSDPSSGVESGSFLASGGPFFFFFFCCCLLSPTPRD